MKKLLLLLFTSLSLSQVKASDTLTIRQIYNFSVGDTFDYLTGQNLNPSGLSNSPIQTYIRYLITGKTLSNDTATYIRHQLYPVNRFDTLTYINLDSSIYWISDTNHISQYITVQTDTLPDGRITNYFENNTPLAYPSSQKYAQGLGLIYYRIPETDGISYYGEDDSVLIYYSKGGESIGTTYYNAIGPRLPHYTPIPEDCAYWNYTQYSYHGQPLLYFQVRVGNKINQNGYTYVELIQRYFDVDSGVLSQDSIFGYYRNDTMGQKVYFKSSMNSTESLLYDFTLRTSDPYNLPFANYYTALDTIIISGKRLIKWSDENILIAGGAQTYFYSYLEGVGSLTGLFASQYPCFSEYQHTNLCPPLLTSFCVCGQILYPDTASGQCQLLTGVNNLPNVSNTHLYPNPAIEQIHLSISNPSQYNAQLILTDLLGQTVYSSPITQSETTHDILKLASGIYTWRVTFDNTIIKTGKVVKQ